MSPELIDALNFLQLCGFVLVGAALYIWYLHRQVDGGCPRCSHCRDIREAKAEADRESQHRSLHFFAGWPMGDKRCDICKNGGMTSKDKATRERLFGREVKPDDVPTESSSDGDETPSDSDVVK